MSFFIMVEKRRTHDAGPDLNRVVFILAPGAVFEVRTNVALVFGWKHMCPDLSPVRPESFESCTRPKCHNKYPGSLLTTDLSQPLRLLWRRRVER